MPKIDAILKFCKVRCLVMTSAVFLMQALPIFLDDMFNEVVAVILSVTFVLTFGEVLYTHTLICLVFSSLCIRNCVIFQNIRTICVVELHCGGYKLTMSLMYSEQVIPQAVCSRHGLAIGANFIWLVKILMVLCWPISYPVGKVNLSFCSLSSAHFVGAMVRNSLMLECVTNS